MPDHPIEPDFMIALRKACAEGQLRSVELERQRQRNEPDPKRFAGEQYVSMVDEMKRLGVEYDAIEMPGAFTDERYDTLRTDVRKVAKALYELGGMCLMKSTLELYISNAHGLHRCFDMAFDDIGGWVA